MNFVAIDVETAIGKRWSICQIGLAIVEGGEIIQTFSKLIQPPRNEYASGNINVHGITPEMTENAPIFPVVWDEIYPLLEGKKLVAHNASFDINCLHQTLDFYDRVIPEMECDCTYSRTGYKLSEICEAFEIELSNHHDATCDAVACAKVYMNLMRGIAPDYSKIRPRSEKLSNFFTPEGHDHLCGDVLKPDLDSADCNSPFYAKKIVFTGVLNSIDRKEAADLVKKMGADIDTSITKRTNFVITGSAPGPSKIQKINQFNAQGYDIRIVYEEEFFRICGIN
ncbi:MAG TPA: exonuclease domain-containing protein [Prolixibacteraceae bacterium]|jgi:DNA polymerase-3 subunit epsilon